MKNRISLILILACLLLIAQTASAEVVRLKSGAIVRGTIVFQNEQVLVVKQADGSRFQYMQSDVAEVLQDEVVVEEQVEDKPAAKQKKVTASLQFAGGLAALPGSAVDEAQRALGANAQADLIVGTADLLGKHILLGGGLGYHMHYIGGRNYAFLPIQLRAEAPLMQTKHAPMLGLGLGYGVSLQKTAKGGAFADMSIGWRCQLNDSRAIALSLYGTFQHSVISSYTDMIEGASYTTESAGRAFVSTGIRLAVYL